MKRLCLIMSLLTLILGINAYELDEQTMQSNFYNHQAITQNNVVKIQLENKLLDWNTAHSSTVDECKISKTYALPYHNAELEIQSVEIESYNQNGQLIQNRSINYSAFA
ncbi:MAG TPA: hypothetical protein PKZ69_07950, partial [Candidatus Cloacimonadota bacterium]|nr:hypothetical protein [Candidatus Cloacimonadota bacterium]